MAACSKYISRFRKALEFRGLPYPAEIIECIGRRATSDRELDTIISSICSLLEPPYCQKNHCPHHTVYGFCGCSLSLVPGKCKLNLDYLKNKKEREEKLIDERIMQLPESKRLNISELNRGRILIMDKKEWEGVVLQQSKIES